MYPEPEKEREREGFLLRRVNLRGFRHRYAWYDSIKPYFANPQNIIEQYWYNFKLELLHKHFINWVMGNRISYLL